MNGKPLELVEPQGMKLKLLEPLLLLGHEAFAKYDIRIRVRGGGYISQVYAIRQALCRALVAYN